MNSQLRNLSSIDLTVQSGKTEVRNITGARLWVIEADAELLVKIGNRDEVPLNLGFKIEEDFSIVTFRNAQPFDVKVRILYGTAEFYDNRLNVVSTRPNQFVSFADAQTFMAVTDAKTSGSTLYPNTLAAAGYVLLSGNRWRLGTTTKPAGRRKCAFISNNDPLSVLEVRATVPTDWKTLLTTTTNGGIIALVQPKTTIRLDVNDDLCVLNNTGSAISLAVSECFYLY